MYRKFKNVPSLKNDLLTSENLNNLETNSKWILTYYLKQLFILDDENDYNYNDKFEIDYSIDIIV